MQKANVKTRIMRNKATVTLPLGNKKLKINAQNARRALAIYQIQYQRSPRMFAADYQRDLRWYQRMQKPANFLLLQRQLRAELRNIETTLAVRVALLV